MFARTVAAASVLILGPALGACGSEDEPDAAPDQDPPAGSEIPSDWTRPGPDYSYTVDAGCGERAGLVGWYRIEVTSGEVSEVWPLGEYADVRPAEAPTIADLVAEATTAENRGADKVTVTTSQAGYPKRISIDPVADAIDDEVCYTVTDVVREAGPLAAWGKPRPAIDWTARREVRLTTWGSSSCPWVPKSVEARGTQSVTVWIEGPDPDTICTADLAPHRSILELPSRIDRGAEELTFVLLADQRQPLVLSLDQNPKLRGDVR